MAQSNNCSAPKVFGLSFILVFGFHSTCTPASKIFVVLHNDITIRFLHHNNVQIFLKMTVFVISHLPYHKPASLKCSLSE